jgi:hypothetical protein
MALARVNNPHQEQAGTMKEGPAAKMLSRDMQCMLCNSVGHHRADAGQPAASLRMLIDRLRVLKSCMASHNQGTD